MIAEAMPLEESDMLAAYSSAKERHIIFDYDGTLTPIVYNPAAAIISPEGLSSIRKLAAEPRNKVWIVSGRDQSFLEQVLGPSTPFGLVAEHGAFAREPGSTDWLDLDNTYDQNITYYWQDVTEKIFQAYVDLTPGSYVEKKRKAMVWHFRQANQDYATLQAAACKADLQHRLGKELPLEFVHGKCVLEARWKTINKGSVMERLVDKSWKKFPDFVLCFGDDVTDEDMFCALRDASLPDKTPVYNVTIGERHKVTNADWILPDPREVIATIMMLNDCDQAHESHGDSSERANKYTPIPRSYLVDSGS